jgi:alkylhydroperoxidase family enzyme
MRIPPWNPARAPRDPALVEAVEKRRGGKLINLDRALLWSEPLTRGWNVFVAAIRRELSISPRLREIAICSVAAVTGADYEFDHHAPEYVKAGGSEALVPRLRDPDRAATDPAFTGDERLAIRYAVAMTRTVKVPQPLFDEIKGRFSETEIVELTAAIACYNMVARILVALEVPEDPDRLKK